MSNDLVTLEARDLAVSEVINLASARKEFQKETNAHDEELTQRLMAHIADLGAQI